MTDDCSQKLITEMGKEFSLPILEILFMKGARTASEVARELSVHISTAQGYLESLLAHNLVKATKRGTRKGLVEYSLVAPRINLTIDLSQIAESKVHEAIEKAGSYLIREKAGAGVSYEWDETTRKILVVNLMRKSREFGWLEVAKTIRLTEVEGRFLWALPQATETRKSVSRIAVEAGLTSPYDLVFIIDLIDLLAQEKILDIEIKSHQGDIRC